MTDVDVFVDPSCPWSWTTSRWIKEVAPQRDLRVTWRSYSCEIRDEYRPPRAVSEGFRERVVQAHAVGHRLLRIFEATRDRSGEHGVDALYAEWGSRYFGGDPTSRHTPFAECLQASGLDPELVEAADDAAWDAAIVASMEGAHVFGGPKTQTPTVAVRSDPPHGFRGPVMSPAPTGEAARRLWDAIMVVSAEPGFFELTRPRPDVPATGHPTG